MSEPTSIDGKIAYRMHFERDEEQEAIRAGRVMQENGWSHVKNLLYYSRGRCRYRCSVEVDANVDVHVEM